MPALEQGGNICLSGPQRSERQQISGRLMRTESILLGEDRYRSTQTHQRMSAWASLCLLAAAAAQSKAACSGNENWFVWMQPSL